MQNLILILYWNITDKRIDNIINESEDNSMNIQKYYRYKYIISLLKSCSSETRKTFTKNGHQYRIKTCSLEEYFRRCDVLQLAYVYDIINDVTYDKLHNEYCNKYYTEFCDTNFGYQHRAIRTF